MNTHRTVNGPLTAVWPTGPITNPAPGTSAAVGFVATADAWTRFVVAEKNYEAVDAFDRLIDTTKLNNGDLSKLKPPMLWEPSADPNRPGQWLISQDVTWVDNLVSKSAPPPKFVSAVGPAVPNLAGTWEAVMSQVALQGVQVGVPYAKDPRGMFILVQGEANMFGTPYWFVMGAA